MQKPKIKLKIVIFLEFRVGFPTQVDFTCAQFRNNCAQMKPTELRAIAGYSAQFRPTFLRCVFFFDKIQF